MSDFFNVWIDLLNMLFPAHIINVYNANGDVLLSIDWGHIVSWFIWIALLVWIITLSTRLFARLWRAKR